MVKYAELTNQNPWWKYGKGYQRFDKEMTELTNQIIKVERKPLEPQQGEMSIIRGCRQIGKTTYLKQLISKLIDQEKNPDAIMYLSVDRLIKTRRELRNAIAEFMRRNMDTEQVYILLDEITALKDWNQELKTMSDSGATQKAKILVTGSSGAALRNTGEQLPGRGLEGNEYYIKPLTFREFITNTIDFFIAHSDAGELTEALKRLNTILPTAIINNNDDIPQIVKTCEKTLPFQEELMYLFNHYLKSGGFPVSINSYLEPLASKKPPLIDQSVAENFVRITLGALSDYGKNETTARQLLDEILTKYGTMFSFTSLSDEVNHVTTGDYLDYLEKSFILHIHYAIDLNKKKPKYKGRKKVYFQDPFIYYSIKSWLTGMSINDTITETLDNEILLSEIIEGIVTSNLVINSEEPYMREKNTFNWFYYDNSGREIDNIIKIKDDYDAIEVKYRNNVTLKDATKTQGLRQTIVLSKDDFITSDDACVIPVSIYLSLLERSLKNL